MSLPVAFRRAAQAEFDKAYNWYEQKQEGLGEQFADAVNEAIDSVAKLPEMHQCIYKDVRRAVVPGFPYSVFYRAKSNKLEIIAVFDGKRNPAAWQKRV